MGKKRFLILLFVCTCLIGVCPALVQGGNDEERILSFYRQYALAFSLDDFVESDRKCDSIMAAFCTARMCRETIEDRENGLGYDFATDNVGIDSLSYRTLRVSEATGCYVVEYDFNDKTDNEQWNTGHAKLRVELEGGKINKVTDMNNP